MTWGGSVETGFFWAGAVVDAAVVAAVVEGCLGAWYVKLASAAFVFVAEAPPNNEDNPPAL